MLWKNLLLGSGGKSVQFIAQDTQTANQSTYTFTDMAIGAPGPGRAVIVCCMGVDSSTVNHQNRHLDAVQMTVLSEIDAAQQCSTTICGKLQDEGSTATFTFSFSATIETCVLATYRVMGLANITPVDTGSDHGNDSDAVNLNLNCASGDILIVAGANNSNTGATIVGANEDFDSSGTGYGIAAGSLYCTTTESPRTVNMDWTGTTRRAGASVTLR